MNPNFTPIRGRFLTQDQAVEAVSAAEGPGRRRGCPSGACSRPPAGRRAAPACRRWRPGPPTRACSPWSSSSGRWRSAPSPSNGSRVDLVRLVFVATPGPGGGGGGGGLRQPDPPARAELKGRSKLASPVAVTKVAKREPVERVETPPPPPPRPSPNPTPTTAAAAAGAAGAGASVVAPVVSAPADANDRAGVPVQAPTAGAEQRPRRRAAARAPEPAPARGPETARASATDRSRAQVAGRTARARGSRRPRSMREVKPVYTEEGRRRSVEGDVVMEVVVRADGSIGTVRVLQGLGSGLDQRAIDAVRQWRFSPARRYGTPVDVLVEIAVEFRLR